MLDNYSSLCSLWVDVNSEWNSFCFVHTFKDYVLNLTLNGEQINSRSKQLPNTFTNELIKPYSFGLNSSFWGQITDFNIWNRPLSKEEIRQYSFGCQEGLSTQPEILDWSTANIASTGINSEYFEMQRQHLTCHYQMNESISFFQNAIDMNYNKSMTLCNLLKGDLFDPTYTDLNQFDQFYYFYWVPIVKSGDYGQSTWKNDTQVGIEKINSNLSLGQKTDECTIVDTRSNKYNSKNCYNDQFPSICKVTVHINLNHELLVAHFNLGGRRYC
jgi:hypothetical protein